VNVHEIAYMIEQNEEDMNILMAILSLYKVLDRLEMNLVENLSNRQRRISRSAGRGRKGGTREKAPTRRKSYNQFRWVH